MHRRNLTHDQLDKSNFARHTLLCRDLPGHFGPAQPEPVCTASLSAYLCWSLLSFPLSFPPSCLTFSLTRPHLPSSLNRKSVFLQCGFMPEIMEMVENFPVVRGEANSEGSLSLALLPSRHPSFQVCIQVGGKEHSRAETRRTLRFMLVLAASYVLGNSH